MWDERKWSFPKHSVETVYTAVCGTFFFFFIHTNTALSWTLLPTCLSVDYNEFHYGVDSLQRCHYGFLAYCSGVQISGCALTGSSLVC